jgi:predicted transcriptional regulator
MGATASTHRLDPDVQAALDRLSKLLRQPKNRIINDAVKSYVRQRSRDLETELEATLNALRANRLRDPNFEDSIEAVVDAEARLLR